MDHSRLLILAALLCAIGGVSACGSTEPTDSALDGLEPGWICPGLAPRDCTTVCGDGIVAGNESCDDGNQQGDDGCDPDCFFERCGDGVQQSSEVCEDGNIEGGDGCSEDCLSVETCGNGIVDLAAGEQCDGEPFCDSDCWLVRTDGDCSLSGVYQGDTLSGTSYLEDDDRGSVLFSYFGVTHLLTYNVRQPGAALGGVFYNGVAQPQILSCDPLSIGIWPQPACDGACTGQPTETLYWTGPLP
jgi:cysteine-rich repeat protein